jgi:structural maintenance of chromosome 4
MTEQRVEKVNRLKIAEKERDNLSGSKIEAEAFLETEKDTRRKKNILYQVFENAANVTCNEYAAKMEKSNEKLALEKSKLGETEQRLAVIQVEYEKVKAEHDKVNSELQKSTTVRNAYIIHCNIYIVLN